MQYRRQTSEGGRSLFQASVCLYTANSYVVSRWTCNPAKSAISSSVHWACSVMMDHLACSYIWLIRTESYYTQIIQSESIIIFQHAPKGYVAIAARIKLKTKKTLREYKHLPKIVFCSCFVIVFSSCICRVLCVCVFNKLLTYLLTSIGIAVLNKYLIFVDLHRDPDHHSNLITFYFYQPFRKISSKIRS